ncbi:MAG TPA: tetratricopeptide repeat protein [Bryobacteraceae bacterium]|jgi:tetratricopeptide (TPR) repeat protein
MRICVIAVFASSFLLAADDPQLALILKAQSEFERVELAPVPELRDTISCTQTQAAVLPLAPPEEQSMVRYRKGFCTLAGAVITHNASEFTQAAAEFDKAIEAWPARSQGRGKKLPPEPVPPVLRTLGAVGRLQAASSSMAAGPAPEGLDAVLEQSGKDLLSSTEQPCAANVMQAARCTAFQETGRQWLGWLALRRNDLTEAARDFTGSAGSGWSEWVAGRRAFQDGNYKEAASQYRQAVNLARRGPAESLVGRLAPTPNVPAELIELGGAQLLAGDSNGAIATLDEAVKASPSNARALFLRARAKETAGQAEAALADYNLASRAAFAGAKDLASGEAHLYRGILLFRRKDYPHAEDEFASALNFEIPGGLRADAVAWRHLAAVATGSCDASRQYLERSLSAASPYFPKAEARTLISACPATISGNAAQGIGPN